MPSNVNSPLQALLLLLEHANAASIHLLQIRHREFTEAVAYNGGDYDYLLDSEHQHRFFTLLHELFTRHAVPYLLDRKKPEKTVLILPGWENEKSITLDIWSALELRRTHSGKLELLSWAAIAGNIVSGNNGYTLETGFEALYYLTHLYTKKKDLQHHEVQLRLRHYRAESEGENDIAEFLDDLLQNGESISNVAAAAQVKLLARLDGFSSPGMMAAFTRRFLKARRRFQSRGNVIAFVGPDGVGKTTIIREYKQMLAGRVKYHRFKKLFRNALLYKLMLPVLRKLAETKHGARLQKNQIDDEFGGLLFLLARLRYYNVTVRRLWKTTMLCDRYFHDFLCRNLRFPERRPGLRPGSRLYSRLMPQPRCLIQLDSDYETIASRKAELTREDVDTYRDVVFSTYLDHPAPYYLYLNTSRSVDECKTVLRQISKAIGVRLYDFRQPAAVTNNPSALNLDNAIELGAGHERSCFINPDDASTCIKVSRYRSGDRNQNRVEYAYQKALTKRGVTLEHIPRCRGWIETTHGEGLVVDRVTGINGEPPVTLKTALQQQVVDCATANTLLDELYRYLNANAIVFADVSLDNIVLGATPEEKQRLYIIDGLGARRYGFKLWLRANLRFLAAKKLRRQWQIVQQQLREHC